MDLLSLGFSGLLPGSCRMIRNRFYTVLVNRLSALAGKASSGWNHPILCRPGASASSSYFNAAGIDRLFCFTAGEIRLGINPAFGSQIPALLRGLGIADDHQLGFRITLQT